MVFSACAICQSMVCASQSVDCPDPYFALSIVTITACPSPTRAAECKALSWLQA